jgi:hypothetical protein
VRDHKPIRRVQELSLLCVQDLFDLRVVEVSYPFESYSNDEFGFKTSSVRESDLTVLFWLPEAARSDWTRLEWTSVTARETSESQGGLDSLLQIA